MAELVRISRDTDFEEIAAFQRLAFGYEWLKSERRRLQCAAYYRWKYLPPAGPAWLAVIRSRDDMVAMVTAVPFESGAGGRRSTAWQICDIATHPQFRQRGHFASCLAALDHAVGSDVMFCFPNQQSRAGLIKAGYAVRSRLRIQARPLFPLAAGTSDAARGDSGDFIECAAAFRADPGRDSHIERSPEFLRWRYADHPLNRYVHVGISGGSACVIVRHLFTGRVGLIVEMWSGSEEGMRAGQEAACRWAKRTGCWALVWARDPSGRSRGRAGAFAKRQLPWEVACYMKGKSGRSSQEMAEHLDVQLGDWDAL